VKPLVLGLLALAACGGTAVADPPTTTEPATTTVEASVPAACHQAFEAAEGIIALGGEALDPSIETDRLLNIATQIGALHVRYRTAKADCLDS
jgi:hypothetical protein